MATIDVIDENRVFLYTNEYGWDIYVRVAIKKGKYGPFVGLSRISKPHEPTNEKVEKELGPFFTINNPGAALQIADAIRDLTKNNFSVFRRRKSKKDYPIKELKK